MKQICIAIDGHSSTGKSTLAKQLAKHLNYIYVDTGAMYRALTLYAMQHQFIDDNREVNLPALLEALPEINLSFKSTKEGDLPNIYLNDVSVEEEIRSLEVSNRVSIIAAIPEVREKLVEQQQQIGAYKGVVMDGRDIGTVVFPDAELKLFMTASAEVRAQRRYDELTANGMDVTYEDVLENVVERDRIDSTREASPLIKAEDAIEIDNSDLGLEEQFDLVLSYVQKALVQGN